MRKTLTGILLAAVAAMMTLSTAVFAADTVKVTATPSEVHVGDTVTLAVELPEAADGAQYTVNYNKDVLSTTDNTNVAGISSDSSHYTPAKITFKAIAEGTADIELKDIILSNDGEALDVATTASTTVKVTKAEEAKAEEPAKTEETKTETPAKAEETKTEADKTKKTLKSAKTGFDAMYVVYLAAAALVAGGVVVATRK